jgi:hypothetical protein
VITLLLLAALSCEPMRTCDGPGDTSCATPTPTIMWDPVPDLPLPEGIQVNFPQYRMFAAPTPGVTAAGYSLWYREPGGAFQLLVDLPCGGASTTGDIYADSLWCAGSHFDIPLQRFCPSCQERTIYEFSVDSWYVMNGTRIRSTSRSAPVPVCFGHIWAKPEPYL